MQVVWQSFVDLRVAIYGVDMKMIEVKQLVNFVILTLLEQMVQVADICVSPKKDAELLVKKGNELKIVYPQEDLDPRSFLDLDFDVFSLQPMDDSNYKSNLNKTLEYCTDNPIWRLSLQVHKYLQIP